VLRLINRRSGETAASIKLTASIRVKRSAGAEQGMLGTFAGDSLSSTVDAAHLKPEMAMRTLLIQLAMKTLPLQRTDSRAGQLGCLPIEGSAMRPIEINPA
jgi:hypothetical protein